jgi:hypothetical protein
MVDAQTPSDGTTTPAATPTERLLALLEQASGPSRELDLLIDRLTTKSEIHSDHLDRWPEHAKHFTSSLDAALTLVPEGWDWNAGSEKAERVGNYAQLFRRSANESEEAWFAGSTPLALCIAALRARLSDEARWTDADAERGT